MARTAKSQDTIEQRNNQPEYDKVIGIVRNRAAKLSDDAKAINGDLSQLWQSVEKDLNVNRWGAKTFMTLDRMEAQRRDDRVRSLLELLKRGGHIIGFEMPRDLVEMAEEGDEEEPAAEEPAPTVVQMPRRKQKAVDAAKEHLTGRTLADDMDDIGE